MRACILLLTLCLFVPLAEGATITGHVYDYNLSETEAIVRITTTPTQVEVAKNGVYEFIVPKGNYTLNASIYLDGVVTDYAEQEVIVDADGNYTVDLILFPEISDIPTGLSDIPSPDLAFLEGKQSSAWQLWAALGGLIAIVVGIFLFLQRTEKNILKQGGASTEGRQGSEGIQDEGPKKTTPGDQNILAFIKKEGHTTQKDIRKAFPYSEAKISMILTDLESRGRVRKIKRGRGNVVVYEK